MPARALARVNLAAIERNVRTLRAGLSTGTELCAVVKADAYGHGAVRAATAALRGGAAWLAVATAGEAVALREAGVGGRILVMGALDRRDTAAALGASADVVAWTPEFVEAVLAARVPGRPRVHVKLDTGMGRLGTRSHAEALGLADRLLAAGPAVELAGLMTHFATADDDLEFLAEQLSSFRPVVAEVRARCPGLIVHAANSGATLRAPEAHFDAVRCGIAIYGGDPMHVDATRHGLEPALELTSYVAAVKRVLPGQSAGYGRRFVAERETWLATVPIGYGDGVRRALTNNGEVLVGGRRYPIAGTVSMDNITVEVGTADAVAIGDTVTLIGASGAQRISAEDVAARLRTINYEVLCGILPRVPRAYHHDGSRG
jgi:alanine racemase